MMTALQIIWLREIMRFLHQRERFFAALVRPLVWLLIFGAGFRAALGLSIIAPYKTYILYETYILPGLAGMIILFNAMQSALSMVYDREMGSMRLLLISPLPRWWLLFCKLLASAFISMIQCYVFFGIAAAYGVLTDQRSLILSIQGLALVAPILLIVGLMLGSFGLFISSRIAKLQNFAGIMNFVIFPMFFASTALYPLWRIQENAPRLAQIVSVNPFTHAVEAIRFALYQEVNFPSLLVVLAGLTIFFSLAIMGYGNAQKWSS